MSLKNFPLFLSLFLFISCSKDDSPKFDLYQEVIGRWNLEGAAETSNLLTRNQVKQANNEKAECHIFSLVFNSNGTFLINHQSGEISGNFSIDDEMTVILIGIGRLENVNIKDQIISFKLSIDGFCKFYGQGRKDRKFQERIYIPDDNFEQALIDANLDDFLNDSVQTTNVLTVTELNLRGLGISDLTGIEFFLNLKDLDVGQNNLEQINVSNNFSLKDLRLDLNQLENIDVSKNAYLNTLWLRDNQLNSLDVSSNNNLHSLQTNGNNSLGCILVNEHQLKKLFTTNDLTWYKDHSTIFSQNCNIQNNASFIFASYGFIKGLAIHEDFLYVAANNDGAVYRFDLQQPSPERFNLLRYLPGPSDVEVKNGYLYISLSRNVVEQQKIIRYDLSRGDSSYEEILPISKPEGIAINDDKIYFSSENKIIQSDLNNPSNQVVITDVIIAPYGWGTAGLAAVNDKLYVTNQSELLMFDLSSPNPTPEILLKNLADMKGLTYLNGSLFFISRFVLYEFALEEQTLKVRSNLRDITSYSQFSVPWDIVGNDNHLFISSYEKGTVMKLKL